MGISLVCWATAGALWGLTLKGHALGLRRSDMVLSNAGKFVET
jgi:hypothetical protein